MNSSQQSTETNKSKAASRRKQQPAIISTILLKHLSLWQHVALFVFVTTVVSISLAWWHWEVPLTTPLNPSSTFRFLTGQTAPHTQNKVIYGFLPYWNLDAELQPELTHTAYFSLGIEADGSIQTRNEDGYFEPGYNRLQNNAALEALQDPDAGNKEIVFTQFNSDIITSFLASDQAQEQFITELDAILLAYPFTGVNIDIEYSGPVSDSLRQNYVDFIATLRNHLNTRYDSIVLSIDVYASAGTKRTIWDIPNLHQHLDYIIVMAYDFHRSSSTVAGPVAPLFGGKELWDSDISQHLAGFLETVPSEKILLGIPFYGYEWQTTSRDAQAPTFPRSGRTASVDRVQTLLEQSEELNVEENWNESALSPYITYEQDGETFVVYYENSRSISYKLDFVNQLDLAGIAIWALGYEGDSRELWEVIDRKLVQ